MLLEIYHHGTGLLAQHTFCVWHPRSKIPYVNKIHLKHLPIPDDDPRTDITVSLPDALTFINEALDKDGVVLIHCRSRASRAVCVTLALLVMRYNCTLTDAYHYVASKRKAMNIFPAYLTQLDAWARCFQRLESCV